MAIYMFEGTMTYQTIFYVEADDVMTARRKATEQNFLDVETGEDTDCYVDTSSCEKVNE